MTYGPDPGAVYPNPAVKRICFIKNVVKNPNIIIGDYTYYDDPEGAEQFEAHVTHHYDFIGDRLIIGKFCAIGRGVEFVMNGANHFMGGITTYPFHIMGGGWEASVPGVAELPLKGDTVVGSDVWIGQNVTVMPGVHIGDGAVIGANATVASDIPAYHIAAGNPCRVIRPRFSEEWIAYLCRLRWWDWSAERIFRSLDILCGGSLDQLRQLAEQGEEPIPK